MCNKFDIRLEGAHRALNDVKATWELLGKLHSKQDATNYINKLYYFKKHGKPNWLPSYARASGL
jgi:DNA polymerase III alpha subunit (gram-positive type)